MNPKYPEMEEKLPKTRKLTNNKIKFKKEKMIPERKPNDIFELAMQPESEISGQIAELNKKNTPTEITQNSLEADHPLHDFLEYLYTLPPSVFRWIETKEKNETTQKTELVREAVANIVNPNDNENLDETVSEHQKRTYHLMSGVGTNNQKGHTMFEWLKPVTRDDPLSNTARKNESGHLTLNDQVVAQKYDGFESIEETELPTITGFEKHGVNVFMSSEHYANPLLRVIIDQTALEVCSNTTEPETHFIEVPLGPLSYSVVLPLEHFLDFLRTFQRNYTQIEIAQGTIDPEHDYNSTITFLSKHLTIESLKKSGFEFNDKAPVLSRFNSAIKSLINHINENGGKLLNQKLVAEIIQNYVRHFFSVERGLIETALGKSPDQSLQDEFNALKKTEIGDLIAPLDTIEEFTEFIEKQRKNKANQKVRLPEPSQETEKSTKYFQAQIILSKTIPNVISLLRRDKEQQAKLNPSDFFEKVGETLNPVLVTTMPELQPESRANIISDFVNLVFTSHRDIIRRMDQKANIFFTFLKPKTTTEKFWYQQFESLPELPLPEECKKEDYKLIGLYRMLLPDIRHLQSLPMGDVFGSSMDIFGMIGRSYTVGGDYF